MRFSVYRYQPDTQARPYMQDYVLTETECPPMLLDALLLLRARDPTLAFRASCREGVCGSDGVNVNGHNRLACITPIATLADPVVIRPMPGLPVIRDLVVDMSPFYRQYRAVQPWLIHEDPEPEIERLQSPEERAELDGLYECILCGCCSTSCPSFWWNPERFLGPAALLQAHRFLVDSRDQATGARLDLLEDPYRLYRCHGIMNCVEACPKGLNPSQSITAIRQMLVKRRL
ncbi:MAG TPA: succinate dehydrogenase iron-sulfur subunit [Acidiferrobacteraceae bacterium]|nr:succinate dehydrogenase iron-sulfur subunit [Acidiferrobacteraceae bacterium]